MGKIAKQNESKGVFLKGKKCTSPTIVEENHYEEQILALKLRKLEGKIKAQFALKKS